MPRQFPTAVARHLYKLSLIHGSSKISFTLISMGLPDGIRKIVENYLQYGKTFQIEVGLFDQDFLSTTLTIFDRDTIFNLVMGLQL